MQIILLENIEKVGAKYEVVKVKDGYGRNYLIPQGKAMVANRQNLGKLKGIQNSADKKANKMLSTYRDWVAKIDAGGALTIPMKAGDSGRLFGSVTAASLASLLNEKYGLELDRRQIVLSDVKEIGQYSAKLDLHKELADAKVDFNVLRESDAQPAEA